MFNWRTSKAESHQDDYDYSCRMDVVKSLLFRNKNKKLKRLDGERTYLLLLEYGWSFGE